MPGTTRNTAQPYFSIVIPTYNRPGYLSDCLYSVLHQSYTDFECIVSDNFNDERTYAVIEPYLNDTRIKYVRTGTLLNMMEHWEWASKHASGKYVLILSDRKLLYKKGLEKAYNTLSEYPDIVCCSVRHRLYNEQSHTMGWSMETGNTRIFRTEQLIDNLLQEDRYGASSLDIYFPKSLNGFYLQRFAEEIRHKYGSYFNLRGATTPDYSSFMINCALQDRSLFIGEDIILTQGETVSTGKKFGAGQYEEYASSLKTDDLYKEVPVKAPYTYNLLITDFLCIKDKIGGNLLSKEICWKNYLLVCLREYYLYKNSNPDLEEGLKKFHLEEWEKGADYLVNIGSITKGDVQEIKQFTEQSQQTKPLNRKLKQFPKYLNDLTIHHLGHLEIINKILPHRFTNVLEAAGFGKINQLPG